MPFSLTRQQFYDVLWTTPRTKLRSVFGISDVMIARIAREAAVPIPGVGYWRQVETGQKVKRVRLPPADLCTRREFSFSGELPPGISVELDQAREPVNEEVETLAERLRERLGGIRIPTSGLHPAIAKMQERDLRNRWSGHRYASPPGKRLLALASSLFYLSEGLGCRPHTRVDYDEFKFDLGLNLSGLYLQLDLDRANGNLTLHPADRNSGLGAETFKDRTDLPLELQLSDIVVSYASLAERLTRKWREEAALRSREEAELERRRKEEETRKAEELAARAREEERRRAIEAAILEATDWNNARLLRAYSQAYAAANHGSEGALAHAAWLRTIADHIDPLLGTQTTLGSDGAIDEHS